VADVIAGVIASRARDVYTRPGARQMVLEYFGDLMQDPPEPASEAAKPVDVPHFQ
jgi:hypothetical protein